MNSLLVNNSNGTDGDFTFSQWIDLSAPLADELEAMLRSETEIDCIYPILLATKL